MPGVFVVGWLYLVSQAGVIYHPLVKRRELAKRPDLISEIYSVQENLSVL